MRKVQITDLCRYSGTLVYVLHFAGSIASFLHPTQWLFWVVGIIASIGVVNFQLYRIAARIPGYPLLPLFRRWARNVPFYASIVLIYSCITVLVSRPEFYLWLDDLPRDPRTLALLQIFTAHIRTIMYLGAGLALSIPMATIYLATHRILRREPSRPFIPRLWLLTGSRGNGGVSPRFGVRR